MMQWQYFNNIDIVFAINYQGSQFHNCITKNIAVRVIESWIERRCYERRILKTVNGRLRDTGVNVRG